MRPVLALLLLAACAPTPDGERALDLSAERLLADITMLASDSFQGRAPGTVGEELTVAYLTAQFQAAGLEPGNPDGSWVQAVDLVGIKGTPMATFRINGAVVPMAWKDDFVAVSRRVQPEVIVPPSETAKSKISCIASSTRTISALFFSSVRKVGCRLPSPM